MKSIFRLTCIAFLILGVVSCQVNISIDSVQDSVDVVDPSSPYIQTFTCTIASDPNTKVNINGSTGKTTWAENDKILVHGEYIGNRDIINSSGEKVTDGVAEQYSTVVTLTSSDIINDGATAIIRIAVDPLGLEGIRPYVKSGVKTTLFASYPADAVKSTNGFHTYNFSDFTNTNKPLMFAYDDGEGNFVFENICSVIAFTVSGEYTFDSFEFSGNNDEVIGYTQYSWQRFMKNDDTLDGSRPYTYGGETTGEVTSISGPVTIDGATKHLIYIIPSNVVKTGDGPEDYSVSPLVFSKGFTLKFYDGGDYTHYASNKNVISLGSGKYLDLGDIGSHIHTYTPPAHVPASWTSEAADLVVSNAANCYIVYHKDVAGYSANAGKAFRIPAVKGKSSSSVGSINSVSILWETYNGTSDSVSPNTVIEAVDYDASYIYFKMPESAQMHTGNALIAAINAMGHILWSWHIWVPSSVVNPITNTKFSPTAIMDRNLGAIQPAVAAESFVPVEAYGLYYQWGRKDPFFTSNWKRNASTDLTFVNPGTVSTDVSVENPTVWYYNNDGSTKPATNNWNSSEVTTLWDDSGKTIYDPCPEGYRTSPRNTSYAMWNFNETSGSPGWSSSSYGWFKYGDGDPEGYGNVIVFPYAGYASGSSLSYSGARSVIWGATYTDLERAYSLYVRHDIVSAGSGIYNYNTYYKSYLGSVRCVAE